MACTIQNYGFAKNEQWVDSNCRALTTDTIACRANVYFDSDGSITLWFEVKKPDNTIQWYTYEVYISGTGTRPLYANLGTLVVGNYYINSVVVTDRANTYQMCKASGTPNDCRSLNVTSASVSSWFCEINSKDCILKNQAGGWSSKSECENESDICGTPSVNSWFCNTDSKNCTLEDQSGGYASEAECKSATVCDGDSGNGNGGNGNGGNGTDMYITIGIVVIIGLGIFIVYSYMGR